MVCQSARPCCPGFPAPAAVRNSHKMAARARTCQEAEAGGRARWEGELGGGGGVTWRREAQTALPKGRGKSRREKERPRQGGKSRKELS